LATALSLFLFCSLGFAIAQTPATKQAEIVNLGAIPYVSVEFEVRAADKQLVIPVCREKKRMHSLFVLHTCSALSEEHGGTQCRERIWQVCSASIVRNTGSRSSLRQAIMLHFGLE
jgi:hypothetical protein